jgi:hypothetical protein
MMSQEPLKSIWYGRESHIGCACRVSDTKGDSVGARLLLVATSAFLSPQDRGLT